MMSIYSPSQRSRECESNLAQEAAAAKVDASRPSLPVNRRKASLCALVYGEACADLWTWYKSGLDSSNWRHSQPRINDSPILVNMNVLALAGVLHDYGYDDHGYYGYNGS
ncbi:hypothetical protein MTO96_016631 [Rhipicephalus appendiculatus]